MNVLKYRVSLDLFDTHSQTTIKAKKGDSACQIHITLTDHGKIYHISEGCYATFSAKKSDGNFVYDNCTIENNTIVYDFASSIDEDGIAQITACEGIAECEVTLYNKDGEQLTSPRFVLYVDGTVYNGEEINSSPEANVLKELIIEAQKVLEDLTVDQDYDSTSENAQSGKAVAKAVAEIDRQLSHEIDLTRNELDRKQNKLTAGNNITIDDNGVISAKGGGGSGGNITVDQTYKPTSENAQSGIAVAEAIADKANVEKIVYEGALSEDIPPSIFAIQKGDWVVHSTYVPDDSGIFYLVYGIEYEAGIMTRGQIDMPTDIITPDKLPTGTRININGDGHWIVLTVIKDVKDKADKVYVDAKIGDINKALDDIIALQESILGGE